MNATSLAIFQTVLATDPSLSVGERDAVQRIVKGEANVTAGSVAGADEKLLVTQKRAAELLSVSRVTVWRMTKDCALHPVEILPGTWRYPYRELAALATPSGEGSNEAKLRENQRSAA